MANKDIKNLPQVAADEKVTKVPAIASNESGVITLRDATPDQLNEGVYYRESGYYDHVLDPRDATKSQITLHSYEESYGSGFDLSGYTVHISEAFVRAMPTGHAVRFIIPVSSCYSIGSKTINFTHDANVVIQACYDPYGGTSCAFIPAPYFTLMKSCEGETIVMLMVI